MSVWTESDWQVLCRSALASPAPTGQQTDQHPPHYLPALAVSPHYLPALAVSPHYLPALACAAARSALAIHASLANFQRCLDFGSDVVESQALMNSR